MAHEGEQLGSRDDVLVEHVAHVAAAVDAAHAAGTQLDVREGGHVGPVVAAEDGADVIVADFSGQVLGSEEGVAPVVGGVVADELVADAVHVDPRQVDGGAVAAAENGVDHTAVDFDVGV